MGEGGGYIPTANNISAMLTFSLTDDDVVVFVDLGVYGGKTSSLKLGCKFLYFFQEVWGFLQSKNQIAKSTDIL